MYKIIGSDGQTYGPVPAETIRQWIAQGRATRQTRAAVEGSTEWRELDTFAEFAEAFAARVPPTAPAQPAAPGPEPFLGQPVAEAIARDVLQRDCRFSIGDCFSRALNLVMAHFALTVGGSAVIFLLIIAASLIPFASLLLTFVLLGGLNWMFLKLLRTGQAEFNDIFAGFSVAFVPLMLFSLIEQLLTGLGFLLCLLPGIYLFVAWTPYTSLLIMDRRIDFWPAMECCRKVVTRHWWQMLAFLLLGMLLNLAGTLFCGIGFFFTFPVTTAAVVVAYDQVFSSATAGTDPAAQLSPGTAP